MENKLSITMDEVMDRLIMETSNSKEGNLDSGLNFGENNKKTMERNKRQNRRAAKKK